MKNLMPVIIIVILIISGLGTVAIPESENSEQETAAICFSQPLLQDNDQYVTIDINPLFQNFLEKHPYIFPLLGKQLARQCTIKTESLSIGSSISKSNCGYLPPVMKLDLEMVKKCREEYNNAQNALIDPALKQKIQTTSNYSILDLLDYVPSERDQHWCGNCWAWPATGVLGIALYVQEGIFDRLSVQYINSCGSKVGVDCCEGGNLHIFARFYRYTDMAIPWSNENAHWKDKFAQCNTPCESISIEPNYPIYDIYEETIETHEIPEEDAIDNIKNVLHQQKGVYFSWYLPDMNYREDFGDFWSRESEDNIYSLDWACGDEFDEEEGGGHGVLCVGYNDEEGTDNDYWVMLNSWGTTSRRPNGLFCVDMHMDYDCTILFDGHEYNSFNFQTLFVDFLSDDEAPNLPIIDGSESGKVNSLCFYNISSVDPQGDDVYFSIDWGDDTTEEWLGPIASGVEMKVNHSWGKRGNYIIKVKAKDIHDIESNWATLKVSMSKNKQYMPSEIILAFGFDVDVKIVQLEPGEDYVDLEVLSKLFYIWENEIETINSGAFIRLYSAKGLFLPSLPFCFGTCQDWGIIG